jgi:hypothetical protein
MVLPSRREGYGIIVLEAAVYGTPSIVVREPDNAALELIEDGVNGIISASADPADLAAAIVRIHAAGEALRESTREWFRRNARRLSLDSSLATVLTTYSPQLRTGSPKRARQAGAGRAAHLRRAEAPRKSDRRRRRDGPEPHGPDPLRDPGRDLHGRRAARRPRAERHRRRPHGGVKALSVVLRAIGLSGVPAARRATPEQSWGGPYVPRVGRPADPRAGAGQQASPGGGRTRRTMSGSGASRELTP